MGASKFYAMYTLQSRSSRNCESKTDSEEMHVDIPPYCIASDPTSTAAFKNLLAEEPQSGTGKQLGRV